MVGVLISTHGELSKGLVDSIKLIMGEQSNLDTMGLVHGKDINEFGNEFVEKVKALDEGQGVIVLVDLYAASPYNQAVMKKNELDGIAYRVVTGVNLPMALELLAMRNEDSTADDLWEVCLNAGKEGIKEFDQELRKFNL